MNQEGLRYYLRGDEWKRLAPVRNPHAIDGDGAGDWTSSMLIHALSSLVPYSTCIIPYFCGVA